MESLNSQITINEVIDTWNRVRSTDELNSFIAARTAGLAQIDLGL